MQMIQVHRYVGAGSRFAAACLRASNLAARRGNELQILARGAEHVVSTAWTIDAHELSPDGAYVLARGDQGRRFGVWDTATGALLFEGHDDSRRESIRASLAAVGDNTRAFVATRSRPSALVVRMVPGGLEECWLSTIGMIAFEVQQVQSLGGTWVGVLGHSDGDQFDTVVAVDLRARDTELLQTALREPPSIKDWGYRVAIGPGTDSQAVIFRDAEWDHDDVPDDEADAFVGIAVWDLATAKVIQRIPYRGPVAVGAEIGGDASRVAVQLPDHVVWISRVDGVEHRIDALALDPYHLAVAHVDGADIVISSL